MFNKFKSFSQIAFALLLIVSGSVSVILACSCIGSGTVDRVFEATPNVVIVKLRAVEKAAEGEQTYSMYGVKYAKLTVETVYKGTLKVGQELRFRQGGGGDCVWTFHPDSIGAEFLLYLGDKPDEQGVWAAGTCTRSNTVTGAAADLLYLDKLAKVKGKTRLSGSITQWIPSPVESAATSYHRLADRKVVVSGGGRNITLKTDTNGVFEIYDLPPGKYRVVPEKIDGFKSESSSFPGHDFEIKEKSHTEANFRYSIDNRIAGKFYDANGRPLKDVCLRLRPASGKESANLFEMDCTEADGSFAMDEIPAGLYVVVINEDGKVTSSQPFGKFYYPAAKRREDASEISVGPGVFIENLVITAPETAETVTVSGFVVHDDGKRASHSNLEYLSIEFFSDNENKGQEYRSADSRAQIDEQGRFRIRILKGDKGELLASLGSFSGRFESCPKHDALFKPSNGVRVVDIKSSPVPINAEGDLSEVELKLPFPSCKRRKIE